MNAFLPLDFGAGIDPWLMANLALAFGCGSYVIVDLIDRLTTFLAGRGDVTSTGAIGDDQI